MTEAPPDGRDTVATGVVLTVALHALAVAGSCAIAALAYGRAEDGLMPFFAIGVVQAAYLLPAYLVCRRNGRRRIGKGLALGAGLTFLLNAGCFGVVLNA